MASPGIVAAATLAGIVLLVSPMLALTAVGVRDGHAPPIDDAE